MPNYLAIDTATECCSAALWFDGKLYSKQTVQPQKHAEIILTFVDELLQQAGAQRSDLDGLILGQGPGAFTGVRIGMGVAQGLALALDLPVVAVSNLESLAYRAFIDSKSSQALKVLVATDARMKEVYTAEYLVDADSIQRLSDERVCKPKEVNLHDCDIYIGSGFHVYPPLQEYLQSQPMSFETLVYSEAKDMLMMVKDQFQDLAQSIEVIEPVYLREP